ncbi:MAG: outer membrane protein assembly factor BamD [Alphaproteobacteria bacterium]|nr:outer membrane protein assembly factor BamD [Alphaproteobacteria bacterium]
MSRLIALLVLLAAFAGALTACATKEAPYVERTVEELYNEAMDKLQAGTWTDAATAFDEVERQHPYSQWAIRAELMSAYAYYRAGEFPQAILAAERYLQLHPGNEDAAYANYLMAVSHYEQIVDVQRDQAETAAALTGLRLVATRYPNTEFARDANLKIDLVREHLAGKEMTIGRFYIQRGEYVSAINRFRQVIKEYQSTSHVPEALYRLTEAYLALGVVPEAQSAAAVLGYNFPGSDWYQDSYRLLAHAGVAPPLDQTPAEEVRSWWRRMTGALFRG